MSNDKRNINASPNNLASLIRGLYGRVAARLNVDPSYVSRVARGERQSEAIEAALEREMGKIMKMVKKNRHGFDRHAARNHGSNRNGTGSSKEKTRTAK